MRIAILGATSMLAADYVATSIALGTSHRFVLFARDPAQAAAAMARRQVAAVPECRSIDRFSDDEYDAIVNFVGVGDPARAMAMGSDILAITRLWDQRALDQLRTSPGCRYIFLSSGAAYGAGAAQPFAQDSRAAFDINDLQPSSFYGIAKFYAEALHRSCREQSIIDIRIFNYLSEYADLRHRFLINDILAAVRDGRTLDVSGEDMQRDYLGRFDFHTLMECCLSAPAGLNTVVDAYSLAEISKFDILCLFAERYGFRYNVAAGGINATGMKSAYFSWNRIAGTLGYKPAFRSEDTLIEVADRILASR